MSSRDEELIDYEDGNDLTSVPITTTQNEAAAVAAPTGLDGDKDKKNYTGIHSTGFRFVWQSPRFNGICID